MHYQEIVNLYGSPAEKQALPLLIPDVEVRSEYQGVPVAAKRIGKLDTGADFTIIPISIIKELGINQSGSREDVGGFDGDLEKREYPEYEVLIRVPGFEPTPLIVLACKRAKNDILLGRDLFTKLLLIVNWSENAVGICNARRFHSHLRWLFHPRIFGSGNKRGT